MTEVYVAKWTFYVWWQHLDARLHDAVYHFGKGFNLDGYVHTACGERMRAGAMMWTHFERRAEIEASELACNECKNVMLVARMQGELS